MLTLGLVRRCTIFIWRFFLVKFEKSQVNDTSRTVENVALFYKYRVEVLKAILAQILDTMNVVKCILRINGFLVFSTGF